METSLPQVPTDGHNGTPLHSSVGCAHRRVYLGPSTNTLTSIPEDMIVGPKKTKCDTVELAR